MLNIHPTALAISTSGTHHERPRGDAFHAGAIAELAFGGGGAGFTPGSLTFWAIVHYVYIHFLICSPGGLAERYPQNNLKWSIYIKFLLNIIRL